MLKGHCIRLKPNNVQASYLARAAGTARFAYNCPYCRKTVRGAISLTLGWALTQWQEEYKAGGKPSEVALRRKLNSIKKEAFPWMLEVTKNAPQMAIIQLGSAFKNFFAKRAARPRYRKKGSCNDRFSLSNDQFRVEDKRIRIPHIGWVRMRERLRFEGKILSATIRRRADRWTVSIAVEVKSSTQEQCNSNDLKHENQVQKIEGVDLGILALATFSTGERLPGPKPHRAMAMRLIRLSRSLSRKCKGSKNWHKAKLALGRLHLQISDIRQDALHKLTSRLAKNYSAIGIESLNVRGMLSNRCLARSVQDMGFFEFSRQLNYKAKQSGCRVVVADRFWASSKTCSSCGYKLKELALNVRSWQCAACGSVHDRDVNAAKNLKQLAVSSTVSACGKRGAGGSHTTATKPLLVKQESNPIVIYG